MTKRGAFSLVNTDREVSYQKVLNDVLEMCNKNINHLDPASHHHHPVAGYKAIKQHIVWRVYEIDREGQ